MKLRLEITFGNAAMQIGDDLARALDKVSAVYRDDPSALQEIRRLIRDANGATVGEWTVEEES